MKEELVSFRVARLAKEKGLKFTSNNSCYNDSKVLCNTGLYDNEIDLEYDIPAPTQSLLAKWLREKHKIHIEINRDEDNWKYELYTIHSGNKHIPRGFKNYLTFEEALDEGLYQALLLIK